MKIRGCVQRSLAVTLMFAVVVPSIVLGAWTPPPAGLTREQRILHVLNRLGYGPRPGDVERVKAIGLDKYIEQQLEPAAIDDAAAEARVKNIDVFNLTTAEIFAKYPNPGALLRQLDGGKRAGQEIESAAGTEGPEQDRQRQRRQRLQELYREYDLRPAAQIVPQVVSNRLLRAVYSEKQLQEVMVDFWQNHFNVYSGKAAVRWFIPSYERDVLRKNALGNFRDLLIGTAQHPAMLFFLDNFQSASPGTQQPPNGRLAKLIKNGGSLDQQTRERLKRRTGATDAEIDQRIAQMRQDAGASQKLKKRGINENYARELMELHTLGVDGGYTQKDIIEIAKCFTGWTIADPRGYRRAAARIIKTGDDAGEDVQSRRSAFSGAESGEFYFNPRWHEGGTKMVLGQKINEGGIKDGLKVLDILVNSPATAKFIARKLCIKFVNDNPDEALVNRVADAFHRSQGDIRTTLKAIFRDPQFFAVENYRAKIKTPFELAVSSIRALGAETNGGPAMTAMLNKMGEVPYGYQAPTGYPDKAEDWVNTGALLERLNFAIAVAGNRIPGTHADLKPFESQDRTSVLDRAVTTLLGGEISPKTRLTLLKQIKEPLPKSSDVTETEQQSELDMRPGQKEGRRARLTRLLEPTGDPEIVKAVSLVLGSPDFQRQ